MPTNFQVIQPGAQQTRFNRRPNFPVIGTIRPYYLHPLMIHPVLPGETMKSFDLKWRVVSKPVKHPLAGCWLETWLMYVKFTDIDRELGQMFVSNDFDPAPYMTAVDQPLCFTSADQIQWVYLCLHRCHFAYFKSDDDPQILWQSQLPMVKMNNTSWYQNMMFYQDEPTTATQGILNQEQQLSAYQMLLQMQMTELSYEQYLQQYGVQAINAETGVPEILRYSRSWTLPTNTVDPTDGTPSSAWVWSEEVKAEKPKRFTEPGFIIALMTARPKVYHKNIKSSLVGNLWGFQDWFPAYTLQDPTAGVRIIDPTDGVFLQSGANPTATTDKLIYDHRDLLSHGEQFVNQWTDNFGNRVPAASKPVITAGTNGPNIRGEFLTDADINALFVDGANGNGLYYEGMAGLNISGHITDTTPGIRG